MKRKLAALRALGLGLATSVVAFAALPQPAQSQPVAETSPSPPVQGEVEGEGDELPSRRPSSSVSESRGRLEGGMASLESMTQSAQTEGDPAKTGCFTAAQEQGQQIMELGTSELLVLQDPKATAEQKRFAQEKLAAAAAQMDGVVGDARRLCGELEDDDDGETPTENSVDAPTSIPMQNPTVEAPAPLPTPPTVAGGQPINVASPSV